jgi:hypothetical protein
MAKHSRKSKSRFINLLATGIAAASLSFGTIVSVQATAPIDVVGESGNFSESFVSVTAVSGDTNSVTFTTVVDHYYIVGDLVSTTGFSTAGFNFSNVVITDTTSNTFSVSSSATGASSAGLAIKRVLPRVTLSSIVGDGTTVTVTAPSHGLVVGQTFEINLLPHVYTYGTKTISAVTANTFSFASTETAVEEDGTVRLNVIGKNLQEDDPIFFRNVFSIGGTNIHAAVTLTDSDEISSSNPNEIEVLQYPPSVAANSKYLHTEVSFDNGHSGDAYAELTIAYFTGNPTSPLSNSVTLRNVTTSVYDVDNERYTSFTNVKTVEPLDARTILTKTGAGTAESGSGTVKFQADDRYTSGATSFTRGRATVTLGDVSSFSLKLGEIDSAGGGASYITDMSSGIRVVTFDSNQGSGSMNSQTSSVAANLSTNRFTRAEFNFAGWNTLANGSGTAYANGASFPFTANTTLFAQWSAVQVNKTVTFDANGGSGSMSSQSASSSTALTANAFTRAGQVFTGWNTEANGSGTTYADGASFSFSADTTLYAQWGNPPASSPFSGPVPMSTATIPTQSQTEATLTGERLNLITGATVNGKPVTLKPISSTAKGLVFPALPAGTYDIVFTYVGGGTVIQQSGLRVTAASLTQTPIKGAPFTITKRFTGYRGDRGPVVARDLRAITAFINANPGLTSITCTGSTSGIPAKSTDQALATARATNACNIVKRLVPGITTSISTITGQGVGQFHRAVIITGQGIRP